MLEECLFCSFDISEFVEEKIFFDGIEVVGIKY